MKSKWIFRVFAVVVFTITLFSIMVMLLWNWLVPAIFQGPTLNLWQAAGLLVLCKILFGHIGRTPWSRGQDSRKRIWRDKFNQKWSCMASEEKHAAQDSNPDESYQRV